MRKNILILSHSDATQFIDIVNQYAQLFDKSQYEVTVAYLTGTPNEQSRQRTIAENILFLNVPKKKIRYLKIGAIKQLLSLCRQKNYHVVICHRYKPAYIMLWVAQFIRIPLLVFVMHELGTMRARGRQLLISALAKKNTLFAGVSNAVRDDIRRSLSRIPQDRIVTLYNMMDTENSEKNLFSREEARKALRLPEDVFVFGHIGRLAINKDQTTLIKAFESIKQHYPRAKLVIAGDGELEHALKNQANQAGLANDIFFTGFLPHAYRYMKAFDCFVLSSIQEAFGRVLIEAMIAKLPIIATQVNGIPEVIHDTGLLITPNHVTQLFDAMKYICDSSSHERNAWGEKAYQRVIQHFSAPAFHQQFWSLYENRIHHGF